MDTEKLDFQIEKLKDVFYSMSIRYDAHGQVMTKRNCAPYLNNECRVAINFALKFAKGDDVEKLNYMIDRL